MKKLINYIYKHELLLGIIGLITSFTLLFYFRSDFNTIKTFPLGFAWFSVFLIGDYLNRITGEGSIFPHRKNQINKFRNLIIAALIMNFVSDLTGSFFVRLWYYPFFNYYIYLLLLAPIGYIIFGLILFVFYRLFKKNLDDNVKPGRINNIKSFIYHFIIHIEFIFGVFILVIGINYYYQIYREFNIVWYEINKLVNININIINFIYIWLGLFFIMEFICYLLRRETLTRDVIRGNFVPLLSIICSSVICIIFVEIFNYPFQIWTFANWPLAHLKLFSIPLIAYLLWPMQYLLLLPLIRIFDGSNLENIW